MLDLSELVPGIHFGVNPSCTPVLLLKKLQGYRVGPLDPASFEFTTHSQTNPEKVTCRHCWHEFPDVQHAYAVLRRTTH